MTIANSENITNNNFCVGKAGVQQMCLLNGVMILVLAPGIGISLYHMLVYIGSSSESVLINRMRRPRRLY